MTRREYGDPVPFTAATLGQTLLRVVVGVIAGAHGVDRLLHLRAFQGELIQLGVPSPEAVAMVVVGLELVAGLLLLVGRAARFAAFLLLCDALAVIAAIIVQGRARELLPALESLTLMAAAAFYFMTAGSGAFSADSALRKRAELKAIRDDEIWQRPPYVAPAGGGSYDTDLVYEAAGAPTSTIEVPRRRWFSR
jgi:uncharacterized membrane protein YphA (DoxX/SURF4 family)